MIQPVFCPPMFPTLSSKLQHLYNRAIPIVINQGHSAAVRKVLPHGIELPEINSDPGTNYEYLKEESITIRLGQNPLGYKFF